MNSREIVPFAGIITFVVNASCLFWYRRFIGTTPSNALRLWLAAFVSAGAVFAYHATRIPNSGPFLAGSQGLGSQGLDMVVALASTGCLVLFAVPFVAKLYFKWVGGLLTDAEKTPGPDGVRAWLKAGNLICALLLSVFAWLGYAYSFWGILAVTIAALLAYPALAFAFQTTPQAEGVKVESSPEREKILKLLAEGKISAEESTGLLNALGQAAKSQAPQTPNITAAHKLVLLGAALVVIGFFLPWFSFNPGREINRQMQNALGALQQYVPGTDFPGNAQLPSELKTGSFSVNGGDMQKGLGWMVLFLGVAAAGLPHFAAGMDAHKMRLVTFAFLGAGAIIVIYLLNQGFRSASVGIVLVMAGYALEFLGTIKAQQARGAG